MHVIDLPLSVLLTASLYSDVTINVLFPVSVTFLLIAGSASPPCNVQVMLISAGQNPVDVHVAMETTSALSTGGPRSVMEGSDGVSINVYVPVHDDVIFEKIVSS